MDAIGSSLSGIRASLSRFDASAARVARASAAPASTGPSAEPAASPQPDLASEMIEQLTAKLTYDANLSVLKTADQMQQSLIRRWA